MKQNKRPKRNYSKYWEESADFNLGKELRIYKFVCGSRMLRKPEAEQCFIRKRDWGKYVYNKYACKDVVQLENFLDYLEQKKRNVKVGQEININYMLPIFAALITGYLVPSFEQWLEGLGNIAFIVKIIAFPIGYGLFILTLFWMIYRGLRPIFDNSDETYFYHDYMKVISDIIKEKDME